MSTVKITPSFGDEKMDGEYDEERYQEADRKLGEAVDEAIAAGARSENLEHTIQNAVEEAGL